MTHYAQLILGQPCAQMPMLVWLAGPCTDYSDSLNFSLTSLSYICCGKRLSISLSVHLSLSQAWHGFATTGKACASVRKIINHYFHIFKCACFELLWLELIFTYLKEYKHD